THNDIVYSTVRPNLKHFGIIKKPNDNMLVSTGFIVIQRKNEYVCIELIYMWLTQKETIDYLQSKAEMSVATYPSIKPEDILNIKTLIPKDKTKLIKFKQLLSPILNTQWKRNEDNKQLEKLRMLLLSIIAKG
ncbi:MAG: restriction endonuclease subunit S, partial [Bacteroidetes bacterium]